MSVLLFASAIFVIVLAVVVAYAYSRQVVKGDSMYMHVVFAAIFVIGLETMVLSRDEAVLFASNCVGAVALLIALARFR